MQEYRPFMVDCKTIRAYPPRTLGLEIWRYCGKRFWTLIIVKRANITYYLRANSNLGQKGGAISVQQVVNGSQIHGEYIVEPAESLSWAFHLY